MQDEGASLRRARAPAAGSWREVGGRGANGGRPWSALATYRLALTAPAACWVGLELMRAPAELHPSMLQWIVLLAAVELAAYEPWGGPGLSVGFGVQVTVVLGNLIDNALKYSPRETVPAGSASATRGTTSPSGCRTQGIGIPDSEVRRIFDRYYRVERKEARGIAGVGLGLSLVRELVEVLGGSIAVESDLGQGSRFPVRLPLRHPAAGQAGRTTNRSRTKVSGDSIRSGTDPGMSPIRHGSSNL